MQRTKQVATLVGKVQAAKAVLAMERDGLVDAEERAWAAEEAHTISCQVAGHIQHRVHQQVASVVSRCLGTVFEDPYEFNLTFERSRGTTTACMTFTRGALVLDPLTEAGGGVVDVAAFALRLACVMLSRPACRRLLVLDEPFNNVHPQARRHRVRDMLTTLAADLGFQIIMVTGIDDLHAGKVVEVG